MPLSCFQLPSAGNLTKCYQFNLIHFEIPRFFLPQKILVSNTMDETKSSFTDNVQTLKNYTENFSEVPSENRQHQKHL